MNYPCFLEEGMGMLQVNMGTNSQLKGMLLFDNSPVNVSGKTVIQFSILDVTMVDAPALTAGLYTMRPDWQQVNIQGKVAFTIPLPNLDYKKQYILAIHIDVDFDNKISSGDYITEQSYPILENTKQPLAIKVVKVN